MGFRAVVLTTTLGLALSAAIGHAGGPFSMHMPRPECSWTPLSDGRVLLAGGIGGDNGFTTEIYDPRTDHYRAGGRLAKNRCMHGAVLLQDGRVLLAAGLDDKQGRPLELEAYDPVHGTSEIVGSLPTGNAFTPAICLRDGRVLIVGLGYRDHFAALWNPKDHSVVEVGHSATTPQSECAAIMLADGRVLITGTGARRSNAFLFDPKTSSLSATGPMHHDRFGHCMTLLRDGRVLVSGGYQQAVCELYDPASGIFTETGSLPAGRTKLLSASLKDGRVLLFGGLQEDRSSTSAVYDPATGRFQVLEGPSGFFLMGSVLSLPDGRVLALDPSETTQVFSPATNRWTDFEP